MKKTIISLAIVILLGAFVFYQRNETANKNNIIALNNIINQPIASGTPPKTTDTTTPITPTPAPTTSGKFKDGEYTGDVIDAFYGKIQVKALVSNGKLADIQFLQYPNSRGETTEISQRSLPILKSEAIKAQNASVDVISGATQTTEGFMKTLKSALSKAA